MNAPTQSKNTTILAGLISLTFACFALSPQARAVCQEGCSGNNTFLGEDALISNTTGSFNTTTGDHALFSNTTGNFNTATGQNALAVNSTGSTNTANGYHALNSNTNGGSNTATGFDALLVNSTGSSNTANGSEALYENFTGNNNTANGSEALRNNFTGNNNTAIGSGALENTSGSSNIALGNNAGANLTEGDSNIDIGNVGVGGEAGVIRIGTTGTQTATFIAGIRGVPISGGTEVGVNSSGQLGVRASSARYKDAIQPMDKASEAILALKPVTFRYKHELDPERIPQFGLVAEEVEKVNPDLVARDDEGKPYAVRYEAVNAMLLNEFLKARRQIDAQQKQINALTEGLQKVSAELELTKPAPQTVNNP